MTDTATDTRPGCTATRHDTSTAYKRAGCRCPLARKAETSRKAKYDRTRRHGDNRRAAQRFASVIPGVPPFHTDPRRNCANLPDPDLMFPEQHRDTPGAVAVCHGCPFTRRCAEWALDTRQVYGVYGGVAPADRRAQISDRRAQVSA